MQKDRRHEIGRGGFCLCPKCGKKIQHSKGRHCMEERCPKYGAKMVRKGSYHHRLREEKKNNKYVHCSKKEERK